MRIVSACAVATTRFTKDDKIAKIMYEHGGANATQTCPFSQPGREWKTTTTKNISINKVYTIE